MWNNTDTAKIFLMSFISISANTLQNVIEIDHLVFFL